MFLLKHKCLKQLGFCGCVRMNDINTRRRKKQLLVSSKNQSSLVLRLNSVLLGWWTSFNFSINEVLFFNVKNVRIRREILHGLALEHMKVHNVDFFSVSDTPCSGRICLAIAFIASPMVWFPLYPLCSPITSNHEDVAPWDRATGQPLLGWASRPTSSFYCIFALCHPSSHTPPVAPQSSCSSLTPTAWQWLFHF